MESSQGRLGSTTTFGLRVIAVAGLALLNSALLLGYDQLLPRPFGTMELIRHGATDRIAFQRRLYHGVQPSPVPCPRGMYRPPGAGITLGECEFCPRGLYGDSPGLESSDCTAKCPKGTYNDRVGAKSILDCKPCPAGVFGSSTGLTTSECSGPCPDGKYSMTEGLQSASECLDCPAYYRGPQGFRGNNVLGVNGGGYPCDRYLSGKSVLNGREKMVIDTINAYLSAERTAQINIIDNKTP